MYSSLKPWVDIEFFIKPFIKRTGTGKALYGDPIKYLCYPDAKMQLIKDASGAEVVSSHTLYLDTNVPVGLNDIVIFEGIERTVLSINTFYRNGTADCLVVYV